MTSVSQARVDRATCDERLAPNLVDATRRFRVHPNHLGEGHAQIVSEPCFEAAAVAYLEHFVPAEAGEAEIGITVQELATGHEHCFLIDL